jgi:heptosyltransferase II
MKILILLPTWLGDTIMATPAIENLVNFHNDSKITLIGSSIAVEVLKNHPKVTKTYVLDKNLLNLYQILKKLGDFDLFVSFRGSLRAGIIKFCISSKKKYKFNKNTYFYGHQVQKYNNFLNTSLNLKSIPSNLVLNYNSKTHHKNNKLLGINPGASYGIAKQWYPAKFAKVAIELSSQYDIVILGGAGEEDIGSDIETHLINEGINNYQNLANKTTIEGLINVISNLDLFITGDSGPMHIAAAFQIPSVTIFGPTKDNETSQWMNKKSAIVKKNLDCQPCMRRTCPLKHHKCMKLIEVSDVLSAVEKLN